MGDNGRRREGGRPALNGQGELGHSLHLGNIMVLKTITICEDCRTLAYGNKYSDMILSFEDAKLGELILPESLTSNSRLCRLREHPNRF